MPALSLPLTFPNSFWSQDYRRGLEVLYRKLGQGVAENEQIVAFIRGRAHAENEIAAALVRNGNARSRRGGFDQDDGASLLVAFRGLQSEMTVQGEVHKAVAQELEILVADPFEEWAVRHEKRLETSRATVIDGYLSAYESAQDHVYDLKEDYLSRMHRADEAEDDAKFAPNAEIADKYTSSPRLEARDARSPPKRTASISERIAQRLKDIQKKTVQPQATSEVVFEEGSQTDDGTNENDEKPLPKVDKGKGKAVEDLSIGSPELLASPPPLSPQLPPSKLPMAPKISTEPIHLVIAGLNLPGSVVSDILKRAKAELNLRPVKFPILGEYQDCFTGEEFVAWLIDAKTPFSDSWDMAEDAARDMTEKEGLLRRLGEIGHKFEASEEAFYQFRPKAFALSEQPVKRHDRKNSLLSPASAFSPVADDLVRRSNTFVNLVSKAMHANDNTEPLHMRARAEADAADKAYRVSVRSLDRQRLVLEEHIEDALKSLQKWESERLRAVKTVLLQFQGTLSNIRNGYQPTLERSSTLIASYQPEADLTALIERYRTGPFRPTPKVYESISHDESDVVFGIDLRKWADGGWFEMQADEKKDKIPQVVTALLEALNQSYSKIPDDMEKRKTWIYEVPLVATHRLRESINSIQPDTPIPLDMLARFDTPVLANTFRLWALELDPPLCLYEGWDDIRRLYPTVGAPKPEDEAYEKEHVQDLQAALQRLPRIHLLVLDAFFSHLKNLIKTTKVTESDDVYITKLALSMGRIILRPKVENDMSIQDRHPTLLFIDLLKHYEEILPFVIANKKRDSERKIPIRKRTAPIDMRMSRSRLSVGLDAKEVLAAQLAARNPNMRSRPSSRAGSPSNAEHALPSIPMTLDAAAPFPVTSAAAATLEQNKQSGNNVTLQPAVGSPSHGSVSSRPVFREPPPELDDVAPPPMPSFAEPPPETDGVDAEAPSVPVIVSPPTPKKQTEVVDDDESPPMPKFVEPPPELEDEVNIEAPTPPSTSPASTPQSLRPGSASPPVKSPTSSGAASPSEDRPAASLARASSNKYLSNRTAGITRGPRPLSTASGENNVTSAVKRFSRTSSPAGSVSPARSREGSITRSASPKLSSPHAFASKKKGGRALAGSFQPRTMESDAEAEVLQD